MRPFRSFLLSRDGFTLVEMLVSLAIVVILLLLLSTMADYTRKTWVYASGKIEEFRGAQVAFEDVTRHLSEATLNTYWDYQYNNGIGNAPTGYMRQSDLRFISGQAATLVGPTDSDRSLTQAIFFQAPLGFVNNSSYSGLSSLLNTWGYFVEFGSDASSLPGFITSGVVTPRYRFRLMELMEPSDNLDIYNYTSGVTGGVSKNSTYTGTTWFTDSLNLSPRPTHVLAENVIALIILPKLTPTDEGTTYTDQSLAPYYTYDSTLTKNNPGASTADANLDPHNQLPPVVQVTMVAVDETNFARFQGASTTMPASLGLAGLFQTVGDTINPSNPGYAKDLQTLQATLAHDHIKFRVFTTNVSLKAAKWSRSETN